MSVTPGMDTSILTGNERVMINEDRIAGLERDTSLVGNQFNVILVVAYVS